MESDMSNKILIANPTDIGFWHLCSLRGALRLEKLGMKRRGLSALTEAKKRFNLKKTSTCDEAFDAVQAEIDRLLEEKQQ
jgi:hypothetical protein